MRVALELRFDEFSRNGFERLKGFDSIRPRDGRIASVVFRFDADDPPTARFLKALASPAPGVAGAR